MKTKCEFWINLEILRRQCVGHFVVEIHPFALTSKWTKYNLLGSKSKCHHKTPRFVKTEKTLLLIPVRFLLSNNCFFMSPERPQTRGWFFLASTETWYCSDCIVPQGYVEPPPGPDTYVFQFKNWNDFPVSKLKYGFCKKLHRYKWTSDQLNPFVLTFLFQISADLEKKRVQLVRGSFVRK